MLPEAPHLVYLFAKENVPYVLVVATLFDKRRVAEAEPSRPEIWPRWLPNHYFLKLAGLEQGDPLRVEFFKAHLQNWFPITVEIRWVNWKHGLFVVALWKLIYQDCVPSFAELHMRVNLQVIILILIGLLDFVPRVVGVLCLCMGNLLNTDTKGLDVFKSFVVLLFGKVMLEEHVYVDTTGYAGILLERFYGVNY